VVIPIKRCRRRIGKSSLCLILFLYYVAASDVPSRKGVQSKEYPA
jgi:hypothetical protein